MRLADTLEGRTLRHRSVERRINELKDIREAVYRRIFAVADDEKALVSEWMKKQLDEVNELSVKIKRYSDNLRR